MFNADIGIDSPLVDAKEKLFFIDGVLQPVHPPHLPLTTLQPPGGALHGRLNIGPLRLAGGTLVKGHGNGGSQVGLNPHALLRPHENLVPVDMGVEVHPLLFDLAQSRQENT